MPSEVICEPALIVPRRSFLVRALGFTATGAARTIPLLFADTAEARIAHHLQEACRALQELYPGGCFHPAFRRPTPWGTIAAGDIVAVIKAAERNPPPGLRSS
ncbi:hypothetical protein [Bradyrhizobium sp. HKCCYLR1051]|uniref:hypothetical protein n=1 Tax=Bradyrhizobium sp. HKCCYLR1051 TaxID=3420738 RepID=UPI003EB92B29